MGITERTLEKSGYKQSTLNYSDLFRDVEELRERYDRVLQLQEKLLSIIDFLTKKVENMDNRLGILEAEAV